MASLAVPPSVAADAELKELTKEVSEFKAEIRDLKNKLEAASPAQANILRLEIQQAEAKIALNEYKIENILVKRSELKECDRVYPAARGRELAQEVADIGKEIRAAVRPDPAVRKRPRDTTTAWVESLRSLSPPTTVEELRAAVNTEVKLPISEVLAAAAEEEFPQLYVDQDGIPLEILESTNQIFRFPPLPAPMTELALPALHDPFILKVLLLVLRHSRVGAAHTRNSLDPSGATCARLRPDLVVWISGLLVFKCEDKASPTDLAAAADELTTKLVRYARAVWGRLPFVLAYASGGATVQFFAIDRKLTRYELTDPLDLTAPDKFGPANRISAIATTVNLARVLCSWYHAGLLQPVKLPLYQLVTSGDNELTLYPTHIHKESPPFDFEETKWVYKEVRRLDMPHVVRLKEGTELTLKGATLKEAKEAKLKGATLNGAKMIAHLVPVGVELLPSTEAELKAALRCVLRALSALHSARIVHRDVRWPNVVLDPESNGTNWTLIDLDFAARVGTPPHWYNPTFPPEYKQGELEVKRIPWQREFDIYQAGCLLSAVGPSLSSPAVLAFATYLRSERPSADTALTHPWLQE